MWLLAAHKCSAHGVSQSEGFVNLKVSERAGISPGIEFQLL
jgi:hypothetical protein